MICRQLGIENSWGSRRMSASIPPKNIWRSRMMAPIRVYLTSFYCDKNVVGHILKQSFQIQNSSKFGQTTN
jgi:hypothetical protein